ncbi:hypothetical protein XFF6994_4970004 [Xanthomonas citri pv. fuscans]|nr:hypothetical protein XFF6994_4970004 [Xanthomonas citri pv. fuscans]
MNPMLGKIISSVFCKGVFTKFIKITQYFPYIRSTHPL